MAEQEKNQKKSLSREQMLKAIQRMIDRTRVTDFDELNTPLDGKLAKKLKQVLEHKKN